MAHEQPQQQPGVIGWLDYRLPIFTAMRHSMEYPAPRNLSYWWNFGSIAGICLLTQIITGIFLVMHYTPHVDMAFDSVEHIMRDVNYGWLIRYVHAVGASMFFGVVYIHIFRGLYYGSYKAPREVLWWLGVVILLVMMGTAFMGYVLPWGQMSLWGATVITKLFSALPVVGEPILTLLLGGFSVDNPTLNRFFSLHYLLPFVLVGVVILHIVALHTHGSNNPLGIDAKGPHDKIPFHPYYTIKDLFGFGVFFIIFAGFVFFAPNYLGHPDNYIPADPMVTPPHIVPEWYFLPFYAILRAVTFDIPFWLLGLGVLAAGTWFATRPVATAHKMARLQQVAWGIMLGLALLIFGAFGYKIDSKLGGVLAMFGSILLLFALPWLDTSKVRSARFRPLYRVAFWVFLFDCLLLGYAGGQSADWGVIIDLPESVNKFGLPDVTVSLLATGYYFAHFLVILPVLGKIEKPLPLPKSIGVPVLAH